MTDSGADKLKRFQWLIAERERSQHLLLKLYEYALDRPALAESDVDRRAFGLLVGVGLSLWRAVFLAAPSREWPGDAGIVEGAKDLLARLLETNALTFSSEKNIESWTVGYYLNNAFDRIESARQLLCPPDSPALEGFSRAHSAGVTSVSPQDGCRIALDVTLDLVSALKAHGSVS